MSPLFAVLAPLVVAAIVLAGLFSWAFPNLASSVAAPSVRFTDVTAESGIHFSHYNGASPGQETPTTLGGGVLCWDYNRDGAPDIFLVNGTSWPWQESGPGVHPTCALYRNDGSGHFTDVTAEAGLNIELEGMSAAVGDYDNDGWPDLMVTAIGQNRLFHNDGNGHFTETTEKVGLPTDDHLWSTGALWLDLDGDQRLDLVVCHYARWPREIDLELAFKIAGVGRSYGAPAGFVNAAPGVYRNRGDGRFEEFGAAAGLRDLDPLSGLPRGPTLAVIPLDANGDGKIDLLFIHQSGEDSLFINQGNGTFRESESRAERREGAAAGLAALSALPSLRLTSPGDTYARWRSGLMNTPGFEPSTTGYLQLNTKAGAVVLDVDLDGRLEVFAGGGRSEPDVNRFDSGRAFAQSPALYWNRGDAWIVAPQSPESAAHQSLVARGIAYADLDGDGDLDLVIAQNGGPTRVLRNDLRSGTAWLRIDLVGTRSPRDGTGAQVEVHTPRMVITRTALPAVSLLGQSEATLTFGLAEDARVRKVTVLWPSGVRQEIAAPTINRRLVITEP